MSVPTSPSADDSRDARCGRQRVKFRAHTCSDWDIINIITIVTDFFHMLSSAIDTTQSI